MSIVLVVSTLLFLVACGLTAAVLISASVEWSLRRKMRRAQHGSVSHAVLRQAGNVCCTEVAYDSSYIASQVRRFAESYRRRAKLHDRTLDLDRDVRVSTPVVDLFADTV